jgi:hypothetical protein
MISFLMLGLLLAQRCLAMPVQMLSSSHHACNAMSFIPLESIAEQREQEATLRK